MTVAASVVGVERPALPRTGWGLANARGTYYAPPRTPKPRTAFIASHYNLDFSQHYLAEPLARRGYGFLGWNTRFCGREAFFLFDRAISDVSLGVEWLHEQGVETVVLLGNSGGGSLMAAYQAQATSPVIRAARGTTLIEDIDGLPPGDLFLSVAAHPGRPEVLTNWLDPAVTDELDPTQTDEDLDMYDAANGPPYAKDFIARYRGAQRDRNERISAWCLSELERLQESGHRDRLFNVHRTWADLRFTDPDIDPSDRPTPACYLGDPAKANRGPDGIATTNTLRSWLAMWSLEHSQYRSEECLPLVAIPSLVVQANGDSGVFPSDARAIFEALGATDKQLVELPGDHYFRGTGAPREDLADVIERWVSDRR